MTAEIAMKALSGILLAAALVLAAPAVAAPAPKNPVAPPAVQQEFDAYLAKFRAALKANDAAAVAGMTRLPFMNDDAVRDAAQFRARTWRESFTAKNRACLQRTRAVYDRDPQNTDTYVMFCGQLHYVFTRTPEGFLFTDIGVND